MTYVISKRAIRSMQKGRETALYTQVAQRLRKQVLPKTELGACLPSDGELARRWKVSARTVREALLVLETQGLVQRQHGRGTVVCRQRLPVAFFSELNLLHPRTPRFFGLVLDLARQRLADAGYASVLYTGQSVVGDDGGAFTCPQLLTDAQAGKVAGVVAIASTLAGAEWKRLQRQGVSLTQLTGDGPNGFDGGAERLLAMAVDYLATAGRERVALIGQDMYAAPGEGRLTRAFERSLHASGLRFAPQWCRVDLSYGWAGAGWEEFREIWYAGTEKPDALVVADENYLPEVTMAMLELGIRVPEELLVVSHQTRHVPWAPPFTIARIEEDVDAFAEALAAEALADLEGRSAPELPACQPYRVIPLHTKSQRTPTASTPQPKEATP